MNIHISDENHIALEAIRRKLLGKQLNYKEIYAVMDQISRDRLGDVLTTYFVASGYSHGFSNEEIYYLTKAMVATGERLHFGGIVADKHSIGGTPGNRATLIVVPIIAAAGFKIPKSSSRAITTPAGTADSMEVLAPVEFSRDQIYKIIHKANACIVWGGSVNIAPADDEIIKIEEPLLFESFDKVLVSVMAKKIAFGSTHVIIDIPYGKTVKVQKKEDAETLGKKFSFLAHKFNMKLLPYIHRVEEPAGYGIGPMLEARDALRVLEQHDHRPLALEERAIYISSLLLTLCLASLSRKKQDEVLTRFKDTTTWAAHILHSGAALAKMKQIIAAQKGNPEITSDHLKTAKYARIVVSHKKGRIAQIHNKNLTLVARLLGAPQDKTAGIYLYKRLHETVDREEEVLTLYSNSEYKLEEACDSLKILPLFELL